MLGRVGFLEHSLIERRFTFLILSNVQAFDFDKSRHFSYLLHLFYLSQRLHSLSSLLPPQLFLMEVPLRLLLSLLYGLSLSLLLPLIPTPHSKL